MEHTCIASGLNVTVAYTCECGPIEALLGSTSKTSGIPLVLLNGAAFVMPIRTSQGI